MTYSRCLKPYYFTLQWWSFDTLPFFNSCHELSIYDAPEIPSFLSSSFLLLFCTFWLTHPKILFGIFQQAIFNESHYYSLFHLPAVTVTKRGKSKLWMPWEKNSFHSLIRFTGRAPMVSRVVESKKALSSQAKSQLTQANNCTSGTEYKAWFSLVVCRNKNETGKQTSTRTSQIKVVKSLSFL